jgi:Uma2 family endonuclease
VSDRDIHDEAANLIDRKEPAHMATTVAVPLRIGLADHGRTMTLEEFREVEEADGYRYELARGVLEVSEVPNDPHGVVVCNLYRAVTRFEDKHPGVVLRYGGGNEFRFWLPHMISGRNPDLGVVLRGAPKDWRGRRLPALAAEVVSRGSVKRDYEVKREEYLAYGLLEYWIVDPLKLIVTVLTRRGDSWDEAVFRDEQVISSFVLPGIAMTVADLWIGIDEVDDDSADPDANGS